MSLSSCSSQIKFRRKTGVFMPALMCNAGDLYQEYTGSMENPQNINPDFSTQKPTISYVLSSSRVAEGYVIPQSVSWYFNDQLLTFSGGISTNVINGETGHFKEIPYAAGSNNFFSIQLLKNLVKASAGAGCVIKGVAKVRIGNVFDEIQVTYPIAISKSVGNQKVVTIAAGDDNFFAIIEKGGSCMLKAITRMGAAEITAGITYKWFKATAGAWELISGQTAQTLSVTSDLVNTSTIIKVEVWQGASMLGMDTQTVMDLSDPYDILLCPNPANETIEENSGGTVTYTPKLVKRGSTTEAIKSKFFFTFFDGAGVVLNPTSATTASTVGVCTEQMCIQADGDVGLNVDSEL